MWARIGHTIWMNVSSDPSSGAGRVEILDRLIVVVARETGVSPARIRLDTALADDLGVAGHDGADLLAAIGREFDMDLTVIDWAEYFGEEAPLDPLRAIWRGFLRVYSAAPPQTIPALRVRDLLRTIETGHWVEPGG